MARQTSAKPASKPSSTKSKTAKPASSSKSTASKSKPASKSSAKDDSKDKKEDDKEEKKKPASGKSKPASKSSTSSKGKDAKPDSKGSKTTGSKTTGSKTTASKKPASKNKTIPEEKEKSKTPEPPKAKANGTKRQRTEEPEDKPAPKKKEVKRRRTGPQVNALPEVPPPRGLALFVWGTGDMGQFGTGPDDLDEKPRPQIHKWIEEHREDGELGAGTGGIESIAAGGMHTLAIDEAGHTRSWGINDNAALGRNTANQPDPENPGSTLPAEDFETWPLVVQALEDEGFRAVKVAAGDSVSVALSADGGLRAWGSFRSNEGILGFDGVPGHPKFQFVPMELPALARAEVVDVACGADHVLALTSDGYVYVWGNGQQNQLGRRILARRAAAGLEPERLGLRHITHVAAGMFHSFAVDKNGDVWAWGLNTYGQTGLDTSEEMIIRPQKVEALSPKNHDGARVIQIEGGDAHSLFLFDNGEVWGVGRQDGNELGLAPDHPAQEGLKERRKEIQEEREAKVKEAEEALEKAPEDEKEDAQMKLLEAQAALRVPMGEYVPEPVRIAFPPIPEAYEIVPELPPWDKPASNPIARISAGTRHNLAVSKSGHVYAWGLGNQGQLGLGSVEEASTPTLVRSKQLRPYDAVDCSAGGQHCVLIAKKREESDE